MWYNAQIMEKFVRWREVLAPTGVYLLLWRGEVVYVGKSLNLYSRLSTHYTNMRRRLRGLTPYDDHREPILFDDVMVMFCPRDMLDKEEAALILRHQPTHNVQHKHPALALGHIPAFQELLARGRRQPSVLRRFPRRPTPAMPKRYVRVPIA